MTRHRDVADWVEYLTYAVLGAALVASVLVLLFARADDAETSPADPVRAAASARAAAVPACRDLGPRGGTCTTGRAVLHIGPAGAAVRAGGLELRATRAVATPATTPSGRARERMRVAVRLRVRNTGGRRVVLDRGHRRIYLAAGGATVAHDPAAERLPGALAHARGLAPGATATGELRFETAGAVTRRLREARRADVGVRLPGRRREIAVLRVRLRGA